jgi:hypothetical protein
MSTLVDFRSDTFTGAVSQRELPEVAVAESRRLAPDDAKPTGRRACRNKSLMRGLRQTGAGDGARTHDPDLGKVVLYH